MITLIIQARTGSSRLPRKVLEMLGEKTVLEYLIERVRLSKKVDQIIIATTDNQKDIEIVNLCKKINIKCFIGHEKNVLKRYYDCAVKYNASVIVRVTSDCPFIDPELIDKMLNNYLKSECDYMSNTTPPELSFWPDGTDIEIFSFDALKKTFMECNNDKEKEHVTFYMWKNNNTNFKIASYKITENFSKFRFTIDYDEDLLVAQAITNYLEKNKLRGSVDEIVSFLRENPEIYKINNKYYPGIGWD